MKGERDKTRLTRDKRGDGTPMFEGQCASEVLQSAPQCAEYTGTYLKCLYTNACSMRDKQEELEALAHSQSYDIIGISETWWDESCD